MFRSSRSSFHCLRRYSTTPYRNLRNERLITASALCAGFGLAVFGANTLFNDPVIDAEAELSPIKEKTKPIHKTAFGGLDAFAWGSNKSLTLLPGGPTTDLKTPSAVPALSGTAFRDVAIHETHAALVDARGDVYQWGIGFDSKGSSEPVLTLRGKDISQLAVSSGKVFALSKSTGKIYVLYSNATRAALAPSTRLPSESTSSSWNPLNWLSSIPQTVDFIELKPDAKADKFISISAGSDHLLALTSSGRTFSHPITLNANTYGQLGYRKIQLPTVAHQTPVEIELVPKSVKDPYASSTKYTRDMTDSASSSDSANLPVGLDDTSIRFCNTLYEVPSLKSTPVSQAVAGERTSYVITKSDGRVLAWGANQYGQLGLGGFVTMECATTPTEVNYTKNTPRTTSSKCSSIAAGKDIAYLTIERQSVMDGERVSNTVDILACGMGQYGALGNNLYTQAQGELTKVKTVSGLVEYDEKTNSLQALRPEFLSVSSHAICTLDTSHRGTIGGKDVLVWGLNDKYQLGNKSRSNSPTPSNIPALPDSPTLEPYMMLKSKDATVPIKDLQGNVVYKPGKAKVEQFALAAPGGSLVYWKILN